MIIKGGTNVYPPFTKSCLFDTPACENPGLTAEFVQVLAKIAGYNQLELVSPNMTGDVYHGIIDLVANNEYDFGANLYSQSLKRHQRVQLSIPVTKSVGMYYFKTRGTDMVELKLIVLKPFMKLVWEAVVLIWFLMMISIFLTQLLALRPIIRHLIPGVILDSIQLSYSLLIHESDVLRPSAPHSNSTQLLIIMCSFGLLFLHNFYNAGLLDQLLKREPPHVFKTTQELADLLKRGEARIVTDYGPESIWSKMVAGSVEGPMADMKLALQMYPPIKVNTRKEVVEAVLSNQYLVGVGGSYGSRYSLRDTCDLTLVEDTATDPSWMSFAFPRTSQGNVLRERFDSIIPALWPYYAHLEEKYYHKTKFCAKEEDVAKQKKAPTALKLSDLQDVFWVWAILSTFSCLAFVIEVILGNIFHVK